MNPRKFGRLDQLTVRVAYGEHPSLPPAEVFLLVLHEPNLGGRPIDDNRLVADLMLLVRGRRGLRRRELPHNLHVEKGHTSWGADGAAVQVLLYVAQEAGGAVIGGVTMAALGRVKRRLSTASPPRFDQMSEELQAYGEEAVRSAFRDWLDDDAHLELIEEEREDASWVGVFRDDLGARYKVVLEAEDGDPQLAHVSRAAPGA